LTSVHAGDTHILLDKYANTGFLFRLKCIPNLIEAGNIHNAYTGAFGDHID
jgi:hypothetical protein